MVKKILPAGMAVLVAAGALAGCGTSETQGTASGAQNASAGGTSLVFADTQAPTSLDPTVSWNSWYTSRYGITETLYKLNMDLTPEPWLAESAEAVDGTTWRITLRDGVTFHNGKALDAQAVIDSWNYTIERNPRLNDLLFIDSMSADGLVLTVTTTKEVPAFTAALCEPLGGIIDVNAGTDLATQPVGTGPFIPESYEVKKQCVVRRYENYWGGLPKLESATFNIIADGSALAMAQQSGESNVSLTIPSNQLSLFENDPQYVVDGATGSRGQVVFLNFQNEWLQDVQVRKALSMCIDKENYASAINQGASDPATGLYPDFAPYGGADLQGYTFDTAAARQLLVDAGYTDTDGDGILEKDGRSLELTLYTYPTKSELPLFGEAWVDAAREAGISLNLQTEAYDAIIERQRTKDFDLMLVSFTMCPTGDPQYFADIAFKTGGSSNYGGYSNAQVDALIEQLDSEFDTQTRYDLAKQIQQLILDDAGFIVIGHAKFTNVLDANITGCETNPSEYYLLTAETAVE